MDKYLQYDHLELSEDASFIRWAKGSESRDENNWDEWLEKHADKREAVEKAKSIVLAMKFVSDTPSKETEEKVWSGIADQINTSSEAKAPEKSRVPRLIQMVTIGAAAAVLLFFFFQNTGESYDTLVSVPYASVADIELPDGSDVTINADTELQYDKGSWDDERVVILEGEAFFSVEKGSKFTVKTEGGSVQVLGTKFNVYQRGNKLQVQCETGKVAVKSAGKETILTRHQSVTVENQKHSLTKSISITNRRSTWRNGVFLYKETKLSDVLAELERQFDVKILIDKSLTDVDFNGSFNTKNLDTAITEVLYPFYFKYEIDGKTVRVSKK